jgi:hypothetical protein
MFEKKCSERKLRRIGTTGALVTTGSPEHPSRIEDKGKRLTRKPAKNQVPGARRIPGREKYCHVE